MMMMMMMMMIIIIIIIIIVINEVKELQKTAILGTAHILRKVLTQKHRRTNAETCFGYCVSETCWRRNDNGLLHVLTSF
jgi:predicted Holliday junction resolvase-like endonuclease